MSSLNKTTPSTVISSAQTAELSLAALIDQADAVLVGAGSGLSAAAGVTYSGPRFERLFGDMIARYGFTDMYTAGFHRFPSPEEKWAYWSRHVLANRYDQPPLPLYERLRELLDGADHFVLTTNVDHAFELNGFDPLQLFATQGDYGLFQCSIPCQQKTWSNEHAVRAMAATQVDGRIGSELVPKCPRCGASASMNLRVDATFVQDEAWRAAARRYASWLAQHEMGRVVYLEIGVGWNTPGVIKYPFWQRVYANPEATLVVVNERVAVPAEIADRAHVFEGDITCWLGRV